MLQPLNQQKYASYKAELLKILEKFGSVTDWSDFVQLLEEIQNIIATYTVTEKYVPCIPILTKRLNQSLNEALPPGVHKQVLNIYILLFQRLDRDFIIKRFGILTIGLFEFGIDCKFLLSEVFLNLIGEYVLPLSKELPSQLHRILLGLLPFIEPDAGDIFDNAYKYLLQLYQNVSSSPSDNRFFLACCKNFINYPSLRPNILFCQKENHFNQFNYSIETYRIMCRVYVEGLKETKTLSVPKMILDDIIIDFPMKITAEVKSEGGGDASTVSSSKKELSLSSKDCSEAEKGKSKYQIIENPLMKDPVHAEELKMLNKKLRARILLTLLTKENILIKRIIAIFSSRSSQIRKKISPKTINQKSEESLVSVNEENLKGLYQISSNSKGSQGIFLQQSQTLLSGGKSLDRNLLKDTLKTFLNEKDIDIYVKLTQCIEEQDDTFENLCTETLLPLIIYAQNDSKVNLEIIKTSISSSIHIIWKVLVTSVRSHQIKLSTVLFSLKKLNIIVFKAKTVHFPLLMLEILKNRRYYDKEENETIAEIFKLYMANVTELSSKSKKTSSTASINTDMINLPNIKLNTGVVVLEEVELSDSDLNIVTNFYTQNSLFMKEKHINRLEKINIVFLIAQALFNTDSYLTKTEETADVYNFTGKLVLDKKNIIEVDYNEVRSSEIEMFQKEVLFSKYDLESFQLFYRNFSFKTPLTFHTSFVVVLKEFLCEEFRNVGFINDIILSKDEIGVLFDKSFSKEEESLSQSGNISLVSGESCNENPNIATSNFINSKFVELLQNNIYKTFKRVKNPYFIIVYSNIMETYLNEKFRQKNLTFSELKEVLLLGSQTKSAFSRLMLEVFLDQKFQGITTFNQMYFIQNSLTEFRGFTKKLSKYFIKHVYRLFSASNISKVQKSKEKYNTTPRGVVILNKNIAGLDITSDNKSELASSTFGNDSENNHVFRENSTLLDLRQVKNEFEVEMIKLKSVISIINDLIENSHFIEYLLSKNSNFLLENMLLLLEKIRNLVESKNLIDAAYSNLIDLTIRIYEIFYRLFFLGIKIPTHDRENLIVLGNNIKICKYSLFLLIDDPILFTEQLNRFPSIVLAELVKLKKFEILETIIEMDLSISINSFILLFDTIQHHFSTFSKTEIMYTKLMNMILEQCNDSIDLFIYGNSSSVGESYEKMCLKISKTPENTFEKISFEVSKTEEDIGRELNEKVLEKKPYEITVTFYSKKLIEKLVKFAALLFEKSPRLFTKLFLKDFRMVKLFHSLKKINPAFQIKLFAAILPTVDPIVLGLIYDGVECPVEAISKRFGKDNLTIEETFALFQIVLYTKNQKIVENSTISGAVKSNFIRHLNRDFINVYGCFCVKSNNGKDKFCKFISSKMITNKDSFNFYYEIVTGCKSNTTDSKNRSLTDGFSSTRDNNILIYLLDKIYQHYLKYSREEFDVPKTNSKYRQLREMKDGMLDGFMKYFYDSSFFDYRIQEKYELLKLVHKKINIEENVMKLMDNLNVSFFRPNHKLRLQSIRKFTFLILSCEYNTFLPYSDKIVTFAHDLMISPNLDIQIEAYEFITALLFKVDNFSIKHLYPLILEKVLIQANMRPPMEDNLLETTSTFDRKLVFTMLKVIDTAKFLGSKAYEFDVFIKDQNTYFESIEKSSPGPDPIMEMIKEDNQKNGIRSLLDGILVKGEIEKECKTDSEYNNLFRKYFLYAAPYYDAVESSFLEKDYENFQNLLIKRFSKFKE